MSESYNRYKELRKTIADLNNAIAVLSWDQETYMPVGGSAIRGQQVATLSGMVHNLSVSNEMEDLLNVLMKDESLSFKEKRNAEESHRVFLREKELPHEFVVRSSNIISESYGQWVKSREDDKFETFAPSLNKVIELSKEKVGYWGYEGHPYNALLDEYEEGLTVQTLDVVFAGVKLKLSPLLAKIKEAKSPDTSCLNNTFKKENQLELCRLIATDLGYDWNRGRLDLSPHPFSTSFGESDCRITTRVNEAILSESIWGTIHEVGHSLYEQGLPASEYGLPSGEAISLGIHESQSRLWENKVGLSEVFIKTYWNEFQKAFPTAFGNVDSRTFYKAINNVTPDLIRINSDELTYHFHILLRYEIEKGMMDGSIGISDLEDAWNEKIKKYLGLDVPSPKFGVLQDIHWSHGSIGYFPTYSLGSFYASQFFAHAKKAIPNLNEQIEKRDFSALLGWLRENIHQHGHTYTAEQICTKATGEALNYDYFDAYVNDKFGELYGL